MTAIVLDFYEGAARAQGYENYADLEDAVIAMQIADIEQAQAACEHEGRDPVGVCWKCLDGFK